MGWNYLFIPKVQRCRNRWSLGMDMYFHHILYQACDYLFILGLKLDHINKSGHCNLWYWIQFQCTPIEGTAIDNYMNTHYCSDLIGFQKRDKKKHNDWCIKAKGVLIVAESSSDARNVRWYEKEMGKLKTHSPTYGLMDNWENISYMRLVGTPSGIDTHPFLTCCRI